MAVSVPVLVNFSVAADDPAPLQLEKECVLIGRIVGRHVMLYPTDTMADPGMYYPPMIELKGFDILNDQTGEWHPLNLSEDGYFCANVGMGRYDLRGRDADGRPYLIHSFSVPRGMAVNLGTFWIETRDPNVLAREGWFSYVRSRGFRMVQEGSNAIAIKLEQITTNEAYTDCENWFASCHDKAYEQFADVMARR
jgi:hypothetical protein